MNLFILPARLHNARNFSLESERAEAETADAELAQERARTTAELAAVVLAGLELRCFCIFNAFCGSCHIFTLYLTANLFEADGPGFVNRYAPTRKGIPKLFSRARASLSSFAVVTMVTFIPLSLSTFA